MPLIIVPGLFGGLARRYYQPLAALLGHDDFLLFRAGTDWDPASMAAEIRQLKGHKQVVCLSLGAMVGNLLADDEDTEVFYLCPYLGTDFINRRQKGYAIRFQRLFKALATALAVIAKPFRRHRWYPLWGGTKPDGWFLSVYAICEQLKYAFSETPAINLVDGVVYSYGDSVVEPTAASITSFNSVEAKTADGKGPSHANLREEGESFGSTTADHGNLSSDAEAYLAAFADMLAQYRLMKVA